MQVIESYFAADIDNLIESFFFVERLVPAGKREREHMLNNRSIKHCYQGPVHLELKEFPENTGFSCTPCQCFSQMSVSCLV